MYDHKHHYFYLNNKPFTVRLQGEAFKGEIYVTQGRIEEDQQDVNWWVIRSPYDATVTPPKVLPPHIIDGVKAWVDTGAIMTVQGFLKGLFGK